MKLSRLLQPSVIFMEGAEKPFIKKVSKTDKTDPKRLKKDLPKLVKSITSEDRVILIGTSNSPWDGDQKLLYQTYDKVIYIPRPDYGSMSLIWKDLLYKVLIFLLICKLRYALIFFLIEKYITFKYNISILYS